MIDFPNLIAGFVLGLVPTLLLWWADHSKQKKEREQAAFDSWKGVAKEIELLLFDKSTTSMTVYQVRSRYPIDTWRSVLGPEPFRALEAVENALLATEHMPAPSQLFYFGGESPPETDADRQRRAIWERKRQAVIAFTNMSRAMQDESYQEVLDKERKAQLSADYRRHPIRTWKRERHNRRMRKADPLS